MASLIISLSDSFLALRLHCQEFALTAANNHRGNGPMEAKVTRIFDFDGMQVIQEVVDEILLGPDPNMLAKGYSKATELLMEQSIPRAIAERISKEVFDLTVDALSTFMPRVSFGSYPDKNDYAIVELYDLYITPLDEIQAR